MGKIPRWNVVEVQCTGRLAIRSMRLLLRGDPRYRSSAYKQHICEPTCRKVLGGVGTWGQMVWSNHDGNENPVLSEADVGGLQFRSNGMQKSFRWDYWSQAVLDELWPTFVCTPYIHYNVEVSVLVWYGTGYTHNAKSGSLRQCIDRDHIRKRSLSGTVLTITSTWHQCFDDHSICLILNLNHPMFTRGHRLSIGLRNESGSWIIRWHKQNNDQ